MICKNCGKEMPEVGAFCPFCASAKEEPEQLPEMEVLEAEVTEEEVTNAEAIEEEQLEEALDESTPEAPAKKAKLKVWQIILIAVGGVLLLGALTYAILFGLGINPLAADNDSYTVSAEKFEKKADRVVATIDGEELTNGELMLYYQNDIFTFLSQYYYYLGYFGLDLTQPLDAQTFPMGEEGVEQTWQEFFLNNSLSAWQQYVLLVKLAEEEGFQPDAETQAQIDNMQANMEADALAYGFTSTEEWLRSELGVAVSAEDYIRFNTSYFLGTAYLNSFYTDKYPTDAEIAAYYTENEAAMNEGGITKDLGLNATVRHILIAPQGGTTDETGVTTYSDEEWAAAEAEAEALLAQWKAGAATEESFTELAVANSDDPGVATNSGLYEEVHINASYLEEFKTWAIEETNKPGDTGIVKTSAGYHIMYFVEGREYYLQLAGEQMVADQIKQMLVEAMERYPMDVNYKKIVLVDVELGA